MNALHDALAPAGPQAGHIAQLWWITVAVCALALLVVLVALAWSLLRSGRGGAATPPDRALDTPRTARARHAVATAVGVGAVGLLALLVASVATDRALAKLPLDNAVNVEIVAHQWWWEVKYDSPEPSRIFTTANEMAIPVGRTVLLKLESDDVIHSFWVPNLHGKKDLIPGHETTFSIRADQAGTYRGFCAEFCGAQHAFMSFLVKAMPPDEWQKWVDAQSKPAPSPEDAKAKRGKELFITGTCMTCHAIQGTTANGRRAPDLTHVASRETLASGRLANTPENLARWIAEAPRIKPGVNMPPHALPREDLDALVAYLETLK